MKRILSLVLLSLSVVLQMAAQRIAGNVYDAKTGEAAPFVNVFYEGTREGVQTDLEGHFSLAYRAGKKLTVPCVG